MSLWPHLSSHLPAYRANFSVESFSEAPIDFRSALSRGWAELLTLPVSTSLSGEEAEASMPASGEACYVKTRAPATDFSAGPLCRCALTATQLWRLGARVDIRSQTFSPSVFYLLPFLKVTSWPFTFLLVLWVRTSYLRLLFASLFRYFQPLLLVQYCHGANWEGALGREKQVIAAWNMLYAF